MATKKKLTQIPLFNGIRVTTKQRFYPKSEGEKKAVMAYLSTKKSGVTVRVAEKFVECRHTQIVNLTKKQ